MEKEEWAGFHFCLPLSPHLPKLLRLPQRFRENEGVKPVRKVTGGPSNQGFQRQSLASTQKALSVAADRRME